MDTPYLDGLRARNLYFSSRRFGMGETVTCKGWSNVPNTGDQTCSPCGGWKNHWLRHSGDEWPELCSVEECEEKATDGAHISNYNVDGIKIIPMCTECNNPNNTDTFDIKDGTILIPAVTVPSCGTD